MLQWYVQQNLQSEYNVLIRKTFTASYALGVSFAIITPVQTTLPFEFYQHSDVFKTRVKK